MGFLSENPFSQLIHCKIDKAVFGTKHSVTLVKGSEELIKGVTRGVKYSVEDEAKMY